MEHLIRYLSPNITEENGEIQQLFRRSQRVLGLTVDVEAHLNKGGGMRYGKGMRVFNRVRRLEGIERRQVKATTRTVIVMSTYFKWAVEEIEDFIEKIRRYEGSFDREFLSEYSNSGNYDYERLERRRLSDLEYATNPGKRAIEHLKKIRDFIERLQEFIKVELREERTLGRFESYLERETGRTQMFRAGERF